MTNANGLHHIPGAVGDEEPLRPQNELSTLSEVARSRAGLEMENQQLRNALNQAKLEAFAGNLPNLNDLVPGSTVTFLGKAPGVVNQLWGTQIINCAGDVISTRAFILHSDKSSSYQTYRRDGRCTYDPAFDIIGISPAGS